MPDELARVVDSRFARRIVAAAFLAFWALVAIRFVVGCWIDTPPKADERAPASHSGNWDFLASRKYKLDVSNNLRQLDVALDQPLDAKLLGALEVYTREARLGATSRRFDTDVAAVLKIIAEHNASIRLETNEGVTPRRNFQVIIRAPVDRFDSCVAKLKGVGEVVTASVSKEDKSSEVRERFAERDALRSHLEALSKLRSTDGDVADLVKLESTIQDVEEKIQKLSLTLGEYVQDESYNNINYALREQVLLNVDRERYPITYRLAIAFGWAVQWSLVAAGLAAFAWMIRWSLRQL